MRLLKVGRDPNCDIVLHSPKASSLHAEITVLNNGDILLEDKNSRNGTFVMNRPIKPGTQISVKRGDAIRFGDVELIWDQVPRPEDLSGYKAVYGIGKSMRNDIQISGNTASRFHATLKIDRKGNAILEDHSHNGSTINGQPLRPGQSRRIKRTDSVACGGVPVNLSQYIPEKPYWILGVVAAVALLIGCWGIWKYTGTEKLINPATTQALENASACVYGGYYYVIDVKDDPFKSLINNWPDKWYMGLDNGGNLVVDTSTASLTPIPYTGTAFFISKDGEMGTNRHVAVPWEYRTPQEEEHIRQETQKAIQYRWDYLQGLLVWNAENGLIKWDDVQAWLLRFQKSPLEISGKHEFFGIGLTGSKINSQIDLQHAQVIAESEDPKKDVALIRLNSRKTPDYLVQMGAVYEIEKARLDERTLQPQEDELIITGYPLGEKLNNNIFDGKELRPTIHRTSLSKIPDDNQIQIQTVGVGGQSGSPVIDKSHRLVGVLCSGFQGTEVTYCCNIKHLVELYNKNRVRE